MRLLLRFGIPAVVSLLALNLVIPEMQMYRDLFKQKEQRVAAKRVKQAANACASKVTYDRLKNLAFDEAVKVRRADARNLHKLAAYSVIRMESPIVKSRDDSLNVTVCSGHFVLEIPPGAEGGFNGERQLKADVEYTAQAAADGSGLIYQLAGAEPIIFKLAAFDLKGHKFTPPAESLLLADAQRTPPVPSPQGSGAAAAATPAAASQQMAAAEMPASATPAVVPGKAEVPKRVATPSPEPVRKARAPARRTAREAPAIRVASSEPASRKERQKVERQHQTTASRKSSIQPARLAQAETRSARRSGQASARKPEASPKRAAVKVARAAQVVPASTRSPAKQMVRHAVAQSVAKRGEMAVVRRASALIRPASRPVAEVKRTPRPAQSRPVKAVAERPAARPVQIAQAAASKAPTAQPRPATRPVSASIRNLSAVVRNLADEPSPPVKPASKPKPVQVLAAPAPKSVPAASKPARTQPAQIARVETSRIVPAPRTVRVVEAAAAPKPVPKPAPVPAPIQARRQQAVAPVQASRCGYARSRSEEMVCMNGRLASLDRSVARLYQAALNESGGRAQYDLRRTQDGFLSYLNRCRNEACLADAFQGRMEEIRDIVVGRWRG